MSRVLDERLQIIADMVPKGARFADIGCDHGYLTAWLLKSKKVSDVQLCDISDPSLQKARLLLGDFADDPDAVVTFSCGDGASALTRPIDCAAIAGMGSATIMHIIEAGQRELADARLILQPNLDADRLRRFLTRQSYMIVDERIAYCGGRHYVIIAAERGTASYDEIDFLCGPVLRKAGSPHWQSYTTFRKKVASDALSDAEKSDSSRADELRKELLIWEEASTWFRQ